MHPVYIVGAGPGDPELLTLKAHRLLQNYADVVLYDRLIPEELLAFIPKQVERVFVGKSADKHFVPQDEIHILLEKYYQQGKKIVRLKGGDPFIFGRGGEEMHFLASIGAEVQIVPGVTAASGCAAAIQLPLTYRGVATSLRFITGHCQKDKEFALNWESIADPDTTLVFYMSLKNADIIASKLIEYGLEPSTPVAIIQEGTTKHQRVGTTQLEQLSAYIQTEGFESPSIIIVGAVASL